MNQYRSEVVIVGDDAAHDITLPDGAPLSGIITTNGGPIYYSFNTDAAASTSGGYIPDGGYRPFGPYANVTQFSVYVATGSTARVILNT